MKSIFKATTTATRVHPVVGSLAEGIRRRVRTLKTFAIDLNTVEGTTLATDILNAVRAVRARGRKGNFNTITITARRAKGPSVVTVTTE
jgi:hypothetical protein